MKFTKEQWQIMIKEQKESGLSKAEFCKLKNIPSSTFHSVVSRLEVKKNESFFTKVKLEPRFLSDTKNLRLKFPQGIYIELILPRKNGHRDYAASAVSSYSVGVL